MTPEVTYDEIRNIWIVTEWISWDEFLIPKGYETDLASIPRLLWSIIAPHELSLLAPIIHDYLYQRTGKVNGRVLTRKEADDIFLRIMIERKIPKWKRVCAYSAVRWFAASHWKE